VRRRVLTLVCIAFAALLFGIVDKYYPHALPLQSSPIGAWASAHYLVDAGRPDIAARHLQEDIQRNSAMRLRAAVWRSVLLAGMGEACFALSDAYRLGGLQRPALSGQFFGYVHEYGNYGKRYALELGDLMSNRAVWLGDAKSVELETNPQLPSSDVDALAAIAVGNLPDRSAALKVYSHKLQEFVSGVLRRMSPDGGTEIATGTYLSVISDSLRTMAVQVGEPGHQRWVKIAEGLAGDGTKKPVENRP
jgi:hypothetical protein